MCLFSCNRSPSPSPYADDQDNNHGAVIAFTISERPHHRFRYFPLTFFEEFLARIVCMARALTRFAARRTQSTSGTHDATARVLIEVTIRVPLLRRTLKWRAP